VALQDARDTVQAALERGLPKPPPKGWDEDGAEGGDDETFDRDWAETMYGTFRRGFRRSRRGNLWRPWRGLTLTVFERRGGFHWCIADGDGARFSPWDGWQDEEEAIRALWDEVGD
jgi:hypothetical protein